jgi:hypothetical protein
MSDLVEQNQKALNAFANATPAGSIIVRNEGGYVARFKVQFVIEGKTITSDSGNFTAGVNKSVDIPSGATSIYLKVEEAWFINSWSTIFTKNFDSPVEKSYTISGTTLNPSWKEN